MSILPPFETKFPEFTKTPVLPLHFPTSPKKPPNVLQANLHSIIHRQTPPWRKSGSSLSSEPQQPPWRYFSLFFFLAEVTHPLCSPFKAIPEGFPSWLKWARFWFLGAHHSFFSLISSLYIHLPFSVPCLITEAFNIYHISHWAGDSDEYWGPDSAIR